METKKVFEEYLSWTFVGGVYGNNLSAKGDVLQHTDLLEQTKILAKANS